jgi:hypothetical protein
MVMFQDKTRRLRFRHQPMRGFALRDLPAWRRVT